MPIDYPDFFNNDNGGLRPVLTDVAELAARLGSSVTYSRTGQVFNMWNGRTGLGNLLQINSATNSILLVTDPTYNNGYAAKLSPLYVSGEVYQMVALFCQPYTLDRHAVEICISLVPPIARFELFNSINDGSQYHFSAIRYVHDDFKWYYYNSSGVYTHFATKELPTAYSNYISFIKLTTDFATDTYVRLDVGDEFFPLDDIPISLSNSAAPDVMGGALWVFNGNGDTGAVYLHHMINTNGEP